MSLLFTNATSDRIDVGSDTSLTGLTAMTMIAWVKATSITANRRIYGYGGFPGFLNFGISGGDGNEFGFAQDWSGNDAKANSNQTVIAINTWQCLAFTYDGGLVNNPNLYFGNLTTDMVGVTTYLNQQPGSGTLATASGSVRVGNTGSATTANKAFPGHIHWVGVWNKVLTLSEIVTQQYNPFPTSGCVGYWPVGLKDSTSTQPDWSASGNTGTVTGATTGDTCTIPLVANSIDSEHRRRSTTGNTILLPGATPTLSFKAAQRRAAAWTYSRESTSALPMAFNHYRRRRAG